MSDGLDLAKVHLKTIFAQVQTFLDMHQVVSAGPFLYAFVQEVCLYLCQISSFFSNSTGNMTVKYF